MADVEVKFDKRKFRNLQRTFSDFPRAIPKIISRAINRTSITARAQIARRIAEKVTARVSDIKKKISRTKATYRHWVSTLSISAKRIPLKSFKPRQIAKGVTYKIEKTSGRKLVMSAFLATMRSGHTGVFKRKSDSRLPIIELHGPSLGQVFEGTSSIVRAVQRSTGKMLEKNIDDQLKLQLEKRKA